MAGNRNVLLFGLGNASEYHSAVWRLWVQGDDVYLAARVQARFLKISLHTSGIWRAAWTTESGLTEKTSGDRVLKRWSRPAEFLPGWTRGISVAIPNTNVKRPFKRIHPPSKKSVHWFPRPSRGGQAHFLTIFAPASAAEKDWTEIGIEGDKVVGILEQKSGGKIFLIYRELTMSNDQRREVERDAATLRINYKASSGSVEPSAEASLTQALTGSDGLPYVLEYPLGWDNMHRERD
jgi:hypothetical protein